MDKLSLKCTITYGAKAYVGNRKVRINLFSDTKYQVLCRTSSIMAKPKSGKIILQWLSPSNSETNSFAWRKLLCVNWRHTTIWHKRTHLTNGIKIIWSISVKTITHCIRNFRLGGNWNRVEMSPVDCIYRNKKETTILRAIQRSLSCMCITSRTNLL